MTIAVNTRFLLGEYLEGYGHFIFEAFSRIASDHPDHRFLFLFDRPVAPGFRFSENVTPLVVGPAARHPLLWKFWYDVRVPALLRKHRADVFVSPDGMASLRTAVPQVLVLHDLAFLHYPGFLPRSQTFFYKRYTPRFLANVRMVATVSEFSRRDILNHYSVPPDRVRVVYSGFKDVFRPLGLEEKAAVRSQYTEGRAFFLCTGALHPRKNLVQLLRAFSLFKKRQQSSFKLVLAGRMAWKNAAFNTLLSTYKYRDDVVLTGYLPDGELARLTASAYALVYPSLFEGFGVPVLEAFRCEVPVITGSGTAMQEIAGDAALFAAPTDPEALADQMMRLYTDESLCRRLGLAGRERSASFTWDRTAALLWDTITAAMR
ncbi:MAG: hypothetical protein RJA57_330 [Bacteroidota bacterium]